MAEESHNPELRPIRLDQFLKLVGIADTGGMAKILIQEGQVLLNGEIETRRRKQLSPTDCVEFQDQQFVVGEYLST